MKKFSMEQIFGLSEQAGVGVPAEELIRKVGISEQRRCESPIGGQDPTLPARRSSSNAAVQRKTGDRPLLILRTTTSCKLSTSKQLSFGFWVKSLVHVAELL